jgi:hypothetical protein
LPVVQLFSLGSMTRVITSLSISGIICLLSAISGVASFYTRNGGYMVTYYQSYLSRGFVALLGCGLLYLAWAVYRRQIIAWRLMFFIHAAAWLGFVWIGTHMVGSEYPQESRRNTLLFAAILAIVSLPVAIFSGCRWQNQKRHFYDDSDDAA